MKKKLRESLIMPEQKPLHHEPQKSIHLRPNQNDEVLKVSPTTKLPTKFDRIQTLFDPEDYKINLNLNVTNRNEGLVMGKIDYSDGKYRPVPDPRSISQFTQYTGAGGSGAVISVGDLDPVRAIQRYKARKRQEKVARILKAYEQD